MPTCQRKKKMAGSRRYLLVHVWPSSLIFSCRMLVHSASPLPAIKVTLCHGPPLHITLAEPHLRYSTIAGPGEVIRSLCVPKSHSQF